MKSDKTIDGLRRLSLPRLPREADEQIARVLRVTPVPAAAVQPRWRHGIAALAWGVAAAVGVLAVIVAWHGRSTAARPYAVAGRIRAVTITRDASGNEHRVTREMTITTVYSDAARTNVISQQRSVSANNGSSCRAVVVAKL